MIFLDLNRNLSLYGMSGYLASSCNSMIIEMCKDIIRISHGFRACQMLAFMAVTERKAKRF